MGYCAGVLFGVAGFVYFYIAAPDVVTVEIAFAEKAAVICAVCDGFDVSSAKNDLESVCN